ncbi:MAG TPA: hypothetical protein VFY13_05075, partial [Luteolibacter sp.]|nr:hypothetical protein [Luteolibacter sp.]
MSKLELFSSHRAVYLAPFREPHGIETPQSGQSFQKITPKARFFHQARMHIHDILAGSSPSLSFEFFPPKGQ